MQVTSLWLSTQALHFGIKRDELKLGTRFFVTPQAHLTGLDDFQQGDRFEVVSVQANSTTDRLTVSVFLQRPSGSASSAGLDYITVSQHSDVHIAFPNSQNDHLVLDTGTANVIGSTT